MNDSYYVIALCYEIPSNVINDPDENVRAAREIFKENLEGCIPSIYQIINRSCKVYELEDTGNYIVYYNTYLRSTDGYPMENFVEVKNIKDRIKAEFEQFFDSVDCGYEFINIKPLV